MSRGPGLTGDVNFQVSTEFYKKGDLARVIAYGITRDEVLVMLQAAHGTQEEWEWDWVVTERRVAMGLGPAWVRAACRYDDYGERVYSATAKATRRGVQQRKGHDGRA